MYFRAWRRAFLLLVAFTVLAPPMVTYALQPTPTVVHGVNTLGSIPAPQPVEIRPRLFVAYGALVAASTLGILYLYRGRAFVVYWIVSWSMLAASFTLNSRGYADVRLGSVMIGLSQLFSVWASALVVLSADAFSDTEAHRWNTPVQAGAATAVWFLAAPFVLPLSAVLYTGPAASAILCGWGLVKFARLARRTPIIGAFMMSGALGVMALLNTADAFMTYRSDWALAYANTLLGLIIVTSIFIALGMHLLVFEDMTDEIRRTNLALAAANEQVKQLAITDPLTGCHNRRFFEEIERREMERHRRYLRPLTVVFVDLVRFKHLNDTFGHDAGDRVLQTVGALLRTQVRQSDYVIRWGGDEFVLLLTCTLTEGLMRAEELKTVFAMERDSTGLPAVTGLSIGVAEVALDSESLAGAIRMADTAMYRDKLAERAEI
jgi:diguanylate cyclase (GGDEF)-like protein